MGYGSILEIITVSSNWLSCNGFNSYETFVGPNRGEHAWVSGAGVNGYINENWQLGAGLIYSLTSHGDEFGGSINAEYSW